MKIGELARLTQCKVETVRYYEHEGLLPSPARSEGNFRQYDAVHLERLRFIRNCRTLDMNLDEIRALLRLIDSPPEDCGGINEIFDSHITHVEARISELEQLKQTLTSLRERCQSRHGVEACGILHGLSEMEQSSPVERHTHL